MFEALRDGPTRAVPSLLILCRKIWNILDNLRFIFWMGIHVTKWFTSFLNLFSFLKFVLFSQDPAIKFWEQFENQVDAAPRFQDDSLIPNLNSPLLICILVFPTSVFSVCAGYAQDPKLLWRDLRFQYPHSRLSLHKHCEEIWIAQSRYPVSIEYTLLFPMFPYRLCIVYKMGLVNRVSAFQISKDFCDVIAERTKQGSENN